MNTTATFLTGLAILLLAGALAAQPPDQGGRQRPFRPAGPMGPAALLAALDKDGDGELSAAEIEGAAAALKILDKDGDGKVGRAEMRPAGMPPVPGEGPGGQGQQAAPAVRTLPRDEREKKVLAVLEDLAANQRRGNMNVPLADARLLRLLTESIGARHVVEIGTSNGYSGIWFCLALMPAGGKLTTFEIDERRAALARENFKRAGVEGQVTLIFGDAHQEVAKLKEPIDVLFIDADKEGYHDYLQKLLPLVRPGGLVLAHNMSSPAPDPKYIQAIVSDPNLETVFLNMDGPGVAVSLKKR